MKNLNLLFNKLYFQSIDLREKDKKLQILAETEPKKNDRDPAVSVLVNINKEIFNYKFKKDDMIPCPVPDAHTFLLETVYPGLLAGTGNPHDGSDDDEAFKLGFSFDYTSGQPIIPGSSVKGALRSHFRNHPEAVVAVCDTVLKEAGEAPLQISIKELENAIFEGNDVFFDAVIYWHDPNGKILSGDHLAPHGTDISKNPIPIYMLRMNPGVKLQFRFKLNDNGLKKERKEKLFYELLKLFGIGAKGNVGYGRLKETSAERATAAVNSNNTAQTSKYVTCPLCNAGSYRTYEDGNLRKKCSRCKAFFPRDFYEKLQKGLV